MMRFAVVLLSAALIQISAPDPARRLYLAAVAAAESSLRLHETDRVKHWLAEAPAALRGWEWRYLSCRADRSAAVFALQHGTISDLAVSPDGRWLAAVGADPSVHLVNARSGTVVRTLSGHAAAVWSPRFSADGRRPSRRRHRPPMGRRHGTVAARAAQARTRRRRHCLESGPRARGHQLVGFVAWWGTVSVWKGHRRLCAPVRPWRQTDRLDPDRTLRD